MIGVSPKYAAQAPVKSWLARLNPPASCSMAKLTVLFACRAAGVLLAANALANADCAAAADCELAVVLMAAAELVSTSTPKAAAARNQTLLCISFPPLGVRPETSTAAPDHSDTRCAFVSALGRRWRDLVSAAPRKCAAGRARGRGSAPAARGTSEGARCRGPAGAPR